MWKKNEVSYPQPEPVIPAHSPVEQLRDRAVIGASIVVKGEISGEEDLVIQGNVEGKIELRRHNVTIGKNGRVRADIYGKIISVEGEINGNICGEEKIVVRSSGVVHGNMTAPRVSLEDGSKFKGSIDMETKQGEKPQVRDAKAAEAKPEPEAARKVVADLAKKSEEDSRKGTLSFKVD